jgi:multidrug efflux system outer membrane protein
VASYLEVLYAEQTLFSSELSLSETKQKFFAAYVNLYKALGGGWITQKEKEDSEKNSTATN